MNIVKEIMFTYDPGYLCLVNKPLLKIIINEDEVSYETLFMDGESISEHGNKWVSKTNKDHFNDLVDAIDSVFNLEDSKETTGTTIKVTYKTNEVREIHLIKSFYEAELYVLIDILSIMLDGLELPPFLVEEDLSDDEFSE